MRRYKGFTATAVAVAMMALAAPASAQTVKIGVVDSFSGPAAAFGEYAEKAMRLYMKLHDKELPPGVKIELLLRDEAGPNPDKAKQLAQELIVRDKVQILAGAGFTPNALAIAPIATQSKTPFLVLNAGAAVVTTKSPFIARFSFSMAQSASPLGTWAAKSFKTAYTLVADYGPGIESEAAFQKSFTAAGGTVAGSVHVPPITLDYSAFLQRVKDAKPQALMVFVPSGKTATALVKGFNDLGLKEAGITLIGTGDITPDEELANMDEGVVGVNTVYHYSSWADRPANKAFVAAWKAEYGPDAVTDTAAVSAWDAMDAIFKVVIAQKGVIDGEKTMELLKSYSNPDSPRGPIAIDPETRDIIQNEYLRVIQKVDGKLIQVETATVATALKDPVKAEQKN